jgi:hypothetical protein
MPNKDPKPDTLTAPELADRYPAYSFVAVDEVNEPILVPNKLFSSAVTEPSSVDEVCGGSPFDDVKAFLDYEECLNDTRGPTVLVCEYTLTRVTEVKRTDKSRQIFPE